MHSERDQRKGNGQAASAWSPDVGSPVAAPGAGVPRPHSDDPVEDGILRLREEAVRMARSEASAGVSLEPAPPPGEVELRERCRSAFHRWRTSERRRLREEVAETEERITRGLGEAALGIDRFERLINDLARLRIRVNSRRREVSADLARERVTRARGVPTPVYLAAISFLGIVEFFANAPVFTALLPRDSGAEAQLRLLSGTQDGITAGVVRVLNQIALRPDAALLAAGVVVFLCVLAHFFGHSLREWVMHANPDTRRETLSGRSPRENLVPMVVTGIGLALVLGVLYESRMMLGREGEARYAEDMARVEELRRSAGWARVDGDLLTANQLTNQADDLEEAAADLREYARSMSGMSLPILLLNLTLVLCAIAAAYFHRRDARKEQFNEDPFEMDRKALLDESESTALEVTGVMAGLVKELRRLRALAAGEGGHDWGSVAGRLEGVVALYRAEAARARGLDPRGIPAFQAPVMLGLPAEADGSLSLRDPADYERERAILATRFDAVRQRFSDEIRAS